MKIELKDVTKKFKDIEVLKEVNLKFENGKTYGFIGRNGSGKSILLKMICAFYEPTNGEILFDNVNIIKKGQYPPSTRALIEKPNFLPDLSGKENLKILASIQNKIGENEIDKTLKMLGLDEGTKQKLGIAQVLMEDPEVMIFDEPFNGLDEKSATKIRNILLEEKKKGKIIIIATHIKEDIDKLCDVVYKIDGGTIQQLDKREINSKSL